jgi:hypothetical protein
MVARQILEAGVELHLSRRGWRIPAAFWCLTRTSEGTPPNHSTLRMSPSSVCSDFSVSVRQK